MIYYAAYLATDPDPATGPDLVSGSAWAESYAAALANEPAPGITTEGHEGPVLSALAPGAAYKIAAVYEDAGVYQSLVTSGVVETLMGVGIGLVTTTDLLDASTRTSLLDPTTDTGGAMAMVIDNGRDTPIDRVFRARRPNQVVDLVGADLFSRFVLHVGEVALDSSIIGLGDAQPFDNTRTVTVQHEGKLVDVKMLRLQLGAQGLAAGTYVGKLVTYDADHPNGLVWDRGFSVKVIA